VTWAAKWCITASVPERLIELDAEIFRLQQKLNEVPTIQEATTLKENLANLEKKRLDLLEEIEREARRRIT
jgi:hypothetical protein